MALPAFNLLAQFWYSIFGNGVVFAIIFLSVVTLILVIFRANLVVLLMVLLPLLVGFALNQAGSNLFIIPTYVQLIAMIITGLLVPIFFIRIGGG